MYIIAMAGYRSRQDVPGNPITRIVPSISSREACGLVAATGHAGNHDNCTRGIEGSPTATRMIADTLQSRSVDQAMEYSAFLFIGEQRVNESLSPRTLDRNLSVPSLTEAVMVALAPTPLSTTSEMHLWDTNLISMNRSERAECILYEWPYLAVDEMQSECEVDDIIGLQRVEVGRSNNVLARNNMDTGSTSNGRLDNVRGIEDDTEDAIDKFIEEIMDVE